MRKALNSQILRRGAVGLAALALAGWAQAEEPMQKQTIEEQIEPVGKVVTMEETAPAEQAEAGGETASARSGSEIYNNFCIACHGSGVAGAPKTGDKAAWASRAEKGMEGLLETATNGLNAMPPMGTCADCSPAELTAAIEYMLVESGIEVDGGASAAAPPAEAEKQDQAQAGKQEQAKVDTSGVDMAKGKNIYQSKCFACHGTGAAGAPVVGKPEQWAARIDRGMDTLMNHAMNGLNAMPPKGTCMDCSEADIRAAVVYMVEESR